MINMLKQKEIIKVCEKNQRFLLLFAIILILADAIFSFIAINYLGLREINPIYLLCGNDYIFLVIICFSRILLAIIIFKLIFGLSEAYYCHKLSLLLILYLILLYPIYLLIIVNWS